MTASAKTASEIATLFENLRALDAAAGPTVNNHDRLIILIQACIADDVRTLGAIIGVLRRLGFDYSHIAVTLKQGNGSDPVRHWWQCDEAGNYRNLAGPI